MVETKPPVDHPTMLVDTAEREGPVSATIIESLARIRQTHLEQQQEHVALHIIPPILAPSLSAIISPLRRVVPHHSPQILLGQLQPPPSDRLGPILVPIRTPIRRSIEEGQNVPEVGVIILEWDVVVPRDGLGRPPFGLSICSQGQSRAAWASRRKRLTYMVLFSTTLSVDNNFCQRELHPYPSTSRRYRYLSIPSRGQLSGTPVLVSGQVVQGRTGWFRRVTSYPATDTRSTSRRTKARTRDTRHFARHHQAGRPHPSDQVRTASQRRSH